MSKNLSNFSALVFLGYGYSHLLTFPWKMPILFIWFKLLFKIKHDTQYGNNTMNIMDNRFLITYKNSAQCKKEQDVYT